MLHLLSRMKAFAAINKKLSENGTSNPKHADCRAFDLTITLSKAHSLSSKVTPINLFVALYYDMVATSVYHIIM